MTHHERSPVRRIWKRGGDKRPPDRPTASVRRRWESRKAPEIGVVIWSQRSYMTRETTPPGLAAGAGQLVSGDRPGRRFETRNLAGQAQEQLPSA